MSRAQLTGPFLPGLQSEDEHHLLGPGADAEMHNQSSQPLSKLEFTAAYAKALSHRFKASP